MSGTWMTARKEVVAYVRKQTQKHVTSTAHDILSKSKDLVPQPGKGQGYALGSLRASGHVVTAQETGYGPAVDAAMEVPRTRIVVRDQIEPPEDVREEPGHARAKVVYPLSYAKLIHDGFHHARGGYRVAGVPFLQTAAEAESEHLHRLLSLMLEELNSIQVMTPAQKQQLRDLKRQERSRASEERRLRSEAAQSRRDLFESIRSRGMDVDEYIQTHALSIEDEDRLARQMGLNWMSYSSEENRMRRARREQRAFERSVALSRQEELLKLQGKWPPPGTKPGHK